MKNITDWNSFVKCSEEQIRTTDDVFCVVCAQYGQTPVGSLKSLMCTESVGHLISTNLTFRE